jgi:hypothetical protein
VRAGATDVGRRTVERPRAQARTLALETGAVTVGVDRAQRLRGEQPIDLGVVRANGGGITGIDRELSAHEAGLDRRTGTGHRGQALGAREPVHARASITARVMSDRDAGVDPARQWRLGDRRPVPQRQLLESQVARQIGEAAVVVTKPAHPLLDRRREAEEAQHPAAILATALVVAPRESAQAALDRLWI